MQVMKCAQTLINVRKDPEEELFQIKYKITAMVNNARLYFIFSIKPQGVPLPHHKFKMRMLVTEFWYINLFNVNKNKQ
jgi:hypothetical protein